MTAGGAVWRGKEPPPPGISKRFWSRCSEKPDMELGTPASSLDLIGLKRSLVRILFVHRFLADVEHCLSELKKARFVLSADVVVTREQFAERLRREPLDLVVAEHPSPNWQETQVLDVLCEMKKDIPVIFLVYGLKRETAAKFILRGASDCIEWKRKDHTSLKVRLSGREVLSEQGELEGYEVIAEDVTRQRELEDHLRQQAASDSLTGLANYRHLVDVLDGEIKRSSRTSREFALLFFDLDELKQINDRYGHMIGSQALCRLADVLSSSCRGIHTTARYGGDECAL